MILEIFVILEPLDFTTKQKNETLGTLKKAKIIRILMMCLLRNVDQGDNEVLPTQSQDTR